MEEEVEEEEVQDGSWTFELSAQNCCFFPFFDRPSARVARCRFHARRSEVHAGEGAEPREALTKRIEVRAQSSMLQSIYGENTECWACTPAWFP